MCFIDETEKTDKQLFTNDLFPHENYLPVKKRKPVQILRTDSSLLYYLLNCILCLPLREASTTCLYHVWSQSRCHSERANHLFYPLLFFNRVPKILGLSYHNINIFASILNYSSRIKFCLQSNWYEGTVCFV